ncbi:hypothetical protein SYK_00540 [Pseudodesulfovibrio nedwellii]|uniref:Uncharacterized protein n=1 Tax=Pseudodesulfovibrio nedwellii TaxID=2973072 RepID=A0ABM8AWC2_9BACT|nr:hypothetical protein SYK_00540 [Pseudodesulfovibrio nedwellii]
MKESFLIVRKVKICFDLNKLCKGEGYEAPSDRGKFGPAEQGNDAFAYFA